MRKIKLLLFLGLTLTQPVLAQNEGDFQIRSYTVPPEHQETLENVLGEAISLALGLGAVRNDAGVSSIGQGQLVVTAPPRVHEDISRFLADFEPAEPVNLKTEYWIVQANPGSLAGDREMLQDIASVLDSIEAAQGSMVFNLLEHTEVLAQSGGTSVFAIPQGEISQVLTLHGDRITGKFDLHFETHRLETEVALTPGQYLVVGGTRWSPEQDQAADEQGMVYFVLRSQVQ